MCDNLTIGSTMSELARCKHLYEDAKQKYDAKRNEATLFCRAEKERTGSYPKELISTGGQVFYITTEKAVYRQNEKITDEQLDKATALAIKNVLKNPLDYLTDDEKVSLGIGTKLKEETEVFTFREAVRSKRA